MANAPEQGDRLPDESEPRGGVDADRLPKFRVIRFKGWKKGIRLEKLFWDVIASAASAAGETVASYVHGRLESSDSANSTSDLRVAALRHTVDENEALKILASPQSVITAMQTAPVPSFAITLNRRIYSANREFMTLLRSELLQDGRTGSLEALRLSFDVPIPRLLEVIAETEKRAVICGFRVASPERTFAGNARVLAAPAAGEPILVAYVMQGKTASDDPAIRTV